MKIEESKRKKRSVDGISSGGRTNGGGGQTNGVTGQTNGEKGKSKKQPQYGCPANYDRIMEHICIRIGKAKDVNTGKETKKDLVADHQTAKTYCSGEKANPLYFSDSIEALNIWKWLGNMF